VRQFQQQTSVNSTINKHDIKLFSADVFLICLKENKMAVTAYSVLYDYDFGPIICVMLGL
jgi:hypothetical protein